ncbi:MAG TPA: MerR family transcriptional regulator [Longimicrobiales bacterium]
MTMTIGQLAGRFGLATHVLRHWESVGVLTPAERVNGRRRYRREHAVRVAMILSAKEAGLSLEKIRLMLEAPAASARRELLARHHAELERRIREIEAAKEMIEHILNCPAEDFTQCEEFQRLVARSAEGLEGLEEGWDEADGRNRG